MTDKQSWGIRDVGGMDVLTAERKNRTPPLSRTGNSSSGTRAPKPEPSGGKTGQDAGSSRCGGVTPRPCTMCGGGAHRLSSGGRKLTGKVSQTKLLNRAIQGKFTGALKVNIINWFGHEFQFFFMMYFLHFEVSR